MIETERKITFWRHGKQYFYKYETVTFKITSKSIKLLKENLILPSNLEFIGLSRAQIGRIITSIYNEDIDFTIKKNTPKENNILHFNVIFFKKINCKNTRKRKKKIV